VRSTGSLPEQRLALVIEPTTSLAMFYTGIIAWRKKNPLFFILNKQGFFVKSKLRDLGDLRLNVVCDFKGKFVLNALTQ